jgi:hypothetical protein
MAGHRRTKDGVASLAYVPAIHAFLHVKQGVDARHKAGHDVESAEPNDYFFSCGENFAGTISEVC